MKKFVVVLMAMAFVVGLSAAAMADVSVVGTVDKDKDITMTETIVVEKDYQVHSHQGLVPSNSAEAMAIKNDLSDDNTVTEEPVTSETDKPYLSAPDAPRVVEKDASINGASFDAATGVINVNQAPGSIVNQGNAFSIGYAGAAAPITGPNASQGGPDFFTGGTFLHAEATAEKILTNNDVTATASLRNNIVDTSFTGVTGVVGVNQSAGNINNQNNAVALSVGDGGAALSDANLGLTSTGNTDTANWVRTTDTLTGAFGGAAGIIGVNQSSGNMNNQANVVAATVATTFPGTF